MGERLKRESARAWLWPASVRRRLSRADLDAHRRSVLERLAPGRTFLDMGGMWGIHGEIAFSAERLGATRSVVCDGMDPTPEFLARLTGSSVQYVQGDLHDPGTVDQLGSFEVVWCTGVLYHTPDPYRLVHHLRRLTTDKLVLGTRTIPEVPGLPGACVFYPALDQPQRDAVAWAHGREAPGMLGAATPFERWPAGAYANFWWGITPSALRAMLDLARFRIDSEFRPHPLYLEVEATALSGDEILPGLDFSRERGSARLSDRA